MRNLLDSTLLAQQYSLPFIMFETNSASCGGFAGVSNVYGIALWALDYGLQMVYSNLTHALIHMGGQDVYYNPFTREFLHIVSGASPFDALLQLHQQTSLPTTNGPSRPSSTLSSQ